MKKYVLVVAVAAALFSCSGNPKADATQTDKNKQETAQVPDRKSTRLNSSHVKRSRMSSSA